MYFSGYYVPTDVIARCTLYPRNVINCEQKCSLILHNYLLNSFSNIKFILIKYYDFNLCVARILNLKHKAKVNHC